MCRLHPVHQPLSGSSSGFQWGQEIHHQLHHQRVLPQLACCHPGGLTIGVDNHLTHYWLPLLGGLFSPHNPLFYVLFSTLSEKCDPHNNFVFIVFDNLLFCTLLSQGTAKPCKYALIFDEIGFKLSELELLTYWTTYLYARCNKSVSYATPAYYAHWASKRAKSNSFSNYHSISMI